MKYLFAALLSIGFAGHSLAESVHDDVRLEMNQILSCEAIHVSLSQVDTDIALSGIDNNAFAINNLRNSYDKLAKVRRIHTVIDQGLLPVLLRMGFSRDLAISERDRVFRAYALDIDETIQKVTDAKTLIALQVLLHDQSVKCDQFVDETELRHTI